MLVPDCAGRVREPDPVGHLEARLAAHLLDRADQVAGLALERQLRRDLGVERDGEPVAVQHREALAGAGAQLELAGLERPVPHPHRAVSEREVALAQQPADHAQVAAILGAEHLQQRHHLDLRELLRRRRQTDGLDAELAGHQVDVPGHVLPPGGVVGGDDHLRQRLAQLHVRRRAGLAAQPHHRAHARHLVHQGGLGKRLADHGIARQVHALRCVRAHAADEVLPQLVRQERHHRRHQAHDLHEGVPQRLVGRALVGLVIRLPVAGAREANVPVREVVDVGLDGPHQARRVVRVERRAALADQALRDRDQPAVERAPGRQVRPLRQRLIARLELVDRGVEDEEVVGVPQREQPPLHLVGGPVAEVHVLRRRLPGEAPAHHVGTHLLDGVVEPDGIAPGLVHGAAGLVVDLLVAEHPPVRRLADQDNAHEQHRVEPQADLLAHLGHPVGREPDLPVGVCGQVGDRDALGRAGGVAALHELGVVPAEGRERHDARVQPAVADVQQSLSLLAAFGAGDPDLVDPRPVQLLQPVDGRGRSLCQLLLGADHRHVLVRAEVEGQRQPPVALAADAPVPHVAEPVLHPLAVLRRCPLDAARRFDHRLAHAL